MPPGRRARRRRPSRPRVRSWDRGSATTPSRYAAARGPSRRSGPAARRRAGRAAGPCRRRCRRRPGRRTTARAVDPPSARVTSCGTVARAESSRACPAYTPPSSGSTSRSVTSAPNLASTRSPTETSPSTGAGGGTSRQRASPSGESTPEASSRGRSSGHAHQRARQRAQRVARPDPGRGEPRVLDRQPQRTSEVDALGPAVEHRLGTDVDAHPRDRCPAQLAADPRGRLQDEHVVTVGGQVARGGQAGDAGTDDDDPLAHGDPACSERGNRITRRSRPSTMKLTPARAFAPALVVLALAARCGVLRRRGLRAPPGTRARPPTSSTTDQARRRGRARPRRRTAEDGPQDGLAYGAQPRVQRGRSRRRTSSSAR